MGNTSSWEELKPGAQGERGRRTEPRSRSRSKSSRRSWKRWQEDREESRPPAGVLAVKHRGLHGGRGGNGVSSARKGRMGQGLLPWRERAGLDGSVTKEVMVGDGRLSARAPRQGINSRISW